MNKFLIVVAVCFFLYKLVHLIIRTMEKKNQNEKHYRKQEFDEKNMLENMLENSVKIGSPKYSPITVTFSNGKKKLSFAAPCSEANLAIMDCLSRYVGADRIDGIGENLDVNYTVTREKHEISGLCEQFVMIINNQLLQKLLNENGMLVSHS